MCGKKKRAGLRRPFFRPAEAPHVFNTASDVDRALNGIKEDVGWRSASKGATAVHRAGKVLILWRPRSENAAGQARIVFCRGRIGATRHRV